MLIPEQALKHWIDNFYGYGSWSAKMWFIAYEEGGGDLPQEVNDKLNYFYANHTATAQPTLCDIRELYRHVGMQIDGPKAGLYSTLYDYRFDSNAIQHNIWKNLICFEHGYKNKKLPDLFDYQRNLFASSTKNNEALIKLYPLPSPHNHAWYYSWLEVPPQYDYLKSRALYESHLYQSRIKNIFQNIGTHKPELVLMYAMNNINALKKSVQEFFPAAKFKMEKAVKLQLPQHHRAELGETTLILTTQIPALRHNRVETGFDWYEFGKMVNGRD